MSVAAQMTMMSVSVVIELAVVAGYAFLYVIGSP